MKAVCNKCLKVITTIVFYKCRGLMCNVIFCDKCYKNNIKVCTTCKNTLLCKNCRNCWNVCPSCLDSNALYCNEEIPIEFD